MAYWRGGGIVPGAGEYKRGDEEARVAGAGLGGKGEAVRGEEAVGLLAADRAAEEEEEGAEGGGMARTRTMQVKSDGSVRFCRKVRRPPV